VTSVRERDPHCRRPGRIRLSAAALVLATSSCDYVDTPSTNVVLDNAYSQDGGAPLVVYQAFWQAVSFQNPLAPGASSGPVSTVPCSGNTAWALLAPGWDPTGSTPPTSFVVLESKHGFAVNLGNTVHIPVDDEGFAGSCAAGAPLSQADADFVTGLVFPTVFAGLHYDAATCRTTPVPDAGTP
jgi:hypothetical protein